ncbi:GntR family transcriptional regulator [Sinorhizobium meliloti]|uniref:GntR family transcriptional regulator n=1 Tax=Rhizobium meliloti TaxID=382 RepID=UPI002E107164|nr:UTRA domain-containing protein [Sinorhizobium meliloti]
MKKSFPSHPSNDKTICRHPSERRMPAYLKIRSNLEQKIEGLQPCARLPPERVLCEEYGVARTTVRQAVLHLEGEGRIFRTRRGRRGWFVAPSVLRYDPKRHKNFFVNATDQGRNPAGAEQRSESCLADDELARLFKLSVGTELFRCSGIAVLDGRRICTESNFLLADAFPGFLRSPYRTPLTQYLEQTFHTEVTQVRFRARVGRLSKTEADELDVVPDTPSLRITRVKADKRGRIVQVDEEAWIASAIEIFIDDI